MHHHRMIRFGRNAFRVAFLCAILIASAGCAVTYIPISWGITDQVRRLTYDDLFLKTLYTRYDPERRTLRVDGSSFDETLTPGQARKRLGAYRQDTKLVYRNLYAQLDDRSLRQLITHEMSHHVWFNFLSETQKAEWRSHLEENPSPFQDFVRQHYEDPRTHEAEFFAYALADARPADIAKLAELGVIGNEEAAAVISELKSPRHHRIGMR